MTVAKLALFVLMVSGGAAALCLNDNRSIANDTHACSYSDQVYESDASLLAKKVPHFNLMTSRYIEMVQAARGHNCAGTAAVAFNGHNYAPVGLGDDAGLAEMVATISSLTGISLSTTYDLIEFAVISLGVLIGYAGFWHLYPDRRGLWWGAAVYFCLGLAEAKVADVYIFQSSPLIAGIPWVLYFGLSRSLRALTLSAALLAFCCSWCSLVRIGTTLICLAFLITLFIGRYGLKKTVLPLLLIMLACFPSMIFARYLIAGRDTFLARVGGTTNDVNIHTVWDSIYIGLAFVPNSEVPEYLDKVGADKVRSIDPTVPYASARFEAILRSEVFKLAKHRPWLVIANLASKTAIVILLALILLYPSRRSLFAEREVLWLDAAFVVAMGISAQAAILVVPRLPHLLTFLCLTLLYSSVKFCRGSFKPTKSKTRCFSALTS